MERAAQRYNVDVFVDPLITGDEKWWVTIKMQNLSSNKTPELQLSQKKRCCIFRGVNLDENATSRYLAPKPIDLYRSGIENSHTRW